MPRNKTAKRPAKRQAKNDFFAILQALENDFLAIPTKLITRISKEMATLKQKENKLKTVANKVKNRILACEKHIKAAKTAKQVKTAKKQHISITKIQTGINNELKNLQKTIELAQQKQNKMHAFRKSIAQFEKEWAQQAKSKKTKKIISASAPKKTKVKAAPLVEHHSPVNTFDNSLSSIQTDNKTEALS